MWYAEFEEQFKQAMPKEKLHYFPSHQWIKKPFFVLSFSFLSRPKLCSATPHLQTTPHLHKPLQVCLSQTHSILELLTYIQTPQHTPF